MVIGVASQVATVLNDVIARVFEEAGVAPWVKRPVAEVTAHSDFDITRLEYRLQARSRLRLGRSISEPYVVQCSVADAVMENLVFRRDLAHQWAHELTDVLPQQLCEVLNAQPNAYASTNHLWSKDYDHYRYDRTYDPTTC